MTQNRNAKRSIRLIEEAFIDILKTKDISKITVKELTEKADLTRNTFYAHFKDVYEVNESVQNHIIENTFQYMYGQFDGEMQFEPIVYFKNVMDFIVTNKDMINALLKHGTADEFINHSSDKVIEKIMSGFKEVNIKDEQGFKIFLKILFTGSMYVINKYLNNEISCTSDELAEQMNKIYLSTYKNYIEYDFKK